ncbi:MAG TPA: ribosome silencing factor, partial [Chlamydiales bacterium]|nr:ribosome silencing factor [Chlamydiales bacterium]
KIAQIIYDKKGFNIVALDVKGISTITDYIVIAEGNIDRHVQAIANSISEEMKKIDEPPIGVEGRSGGDWIVMDFVGIMVHLFMPDMREKYQIEKLFENAKIVDLEIDTNSSNDHDFF